MHIKNRKQDVRNDVLLLTCEQYCPGTCQNRKRMKGCIGKENLYFLEDLTIQMCIQNEAVWKFIFKNL